MLSGLLYETPVSDQIGRNTWLVGDSWTLVEDHELSLDPSAEWNDEEVEAEEPLHRIQRWNGNFFEKATLQGIGLHVQLNHTSMRCLAPIPGHVAFKVLHTMGIHSVSVDYCGRTREVPQHTQLLCCGWYPASHKVPTTCATFCLLDFFHLLSLCSKVSVYDFYRTLEKLSLNTGIAVSKLRYKMLMCMKLQWAHLKMLKQAGRAHIGNGVETTERGDLAMLCPSCPRPGINLPDGWEKAPPKMRFLYMLIVCMDANFRLKNQLVSSFSRDLGLGIGWAYFVPWLTFDEHIRKHISEEDISSCVGFAALTKADTKYSKGLRFTGMGAVLCARGEFIMNAIDARLRYAPMDYVFGTAIQAFVSLAVGVISYDIACQWFVNLYSCMKDWPVEIRINGPLSFSPVIPKFHYPAHHDENHHEFSCNLVKGMGASDCEGPEHIWGSHNVLGNATKTMGTGSRHDVLDDHFGFWNWLKYIAMVGRHYACSGKLLSFQNPSLWKILSTLMVNMLLIRRAVMGEKQVEKELEAEEKERQCRGGIIRNATRLELEESQRSFIVGGVLRSIYMPGLVQYLLEIQESSLLVGGDGDEHPEEAKLWMPSDIPVENQRAVCVEGLPSMEDQLRTAQCHDALHGIQHILRLKLRMVQYKNKNTHGQKDSTRSRTVIDTVHRRALSLAIKYRVSREAKVQLVGPGSWESVLRVLRNEDIRAYTDPARLPRGPGRKGTNEDGDEPSRASAPQEEGDNDEILRSEWCFSRARAKEEMQCVLQFLNWKAKWWVDRKALREVKDDACLSEGLHAYAEWQRDGMWAVPLEEYDEGGGGKEMDDGLADDEEQMDEGDGADSDSVFTEEEEEDM
ncbi:hypothetical protein IW262DRAFT_1450772 [Armillaria fumosa]|nr:hypothetical protein IW262DRAFT_1450772 [Armillaria fumosa]